MELYRVKQIRENIWLIGEDLRPDFTDTMVLVAGKERAALIDTGCGIGNLKKVAERYTKLPLTVLTTHVHLDHVGGHGMFSEIYASGTEMRLWEQKGLFETSLSDRLEFLRTALEGDTEKYLDIEKNICKKSRFLWKPLKDGMRFNLGGLSLTACMVPGHTRESFVFVEPERGDAFVGDSINPTPWILNREEAAVETYGKSVRNFQRRFPMVRHLYSGHCMEDIGIQTIADTLDCVDEILSGAEDPEIVCYAGKVLSHRKGSVTMFYRKENVY